MERIKQEQIILQEIASSRKLECRLQERVSIIISYEKLQVKSKVSKDLPIDIQKVYRWTKRWELSLLIREELYESYKKDKLNYRIYKQELLALLSDATRIGAPAKFTLSEREQIVALGNTKPEELDLPFTHWSLELLQLEVLERGIVKSISIRQIGRFLKSAPLTAS